MPYVEGDRLKEFERKGADVVYMEVAQRMHGQAPDSPHWAETMAWITLQWRKREQRSAWITRAISFAALIVSIAAFFIRKP